MARRGRGRGRQPARGTSGPEQDGAQRGGSGLRRGPAFFASQLSPLSALRTERGKAPRNAKATSYQVPACAISSFALVPSRLIRKPAARRVARGRNRVTPASLEQQRCSPLRGSPPPPLWRPFSLHHQFLTKENTDPPPPKISQWPIGFWAL